MAESTEYRAEDVLLNLRKKEDTAHASGDSGMMMLAVRSATATALAGTAGDYIPLIVDGSGQLYVTAAVSAGTITAVTDITNSVKTQTRDEAELSAGRSFLGIWTKNALANAGNTNFVITTHATRDLWLTGIQVTASAGSSTLEIYENVDLNATPGGTAITPINLNRNSATAAVATCLGDPTIDAEASKILLGTFTVASGNNFYDYGALDHPIILKSGETSTLRVTNGSGDAANFVVYAWFTEDAA